MLLFLLLLSLLLLILLSLYQFYCYYYIIIINFNISVIKIILNIVTTILLTNVRNLLFPGSRSVQRIFGWRHRCDTVTLLCWTFSKNEVVIYCVVVLMMLHGVIDCWTLCVVLYCVVLYCILLYCMYCIVLYFVVLYCIVLYCIVMYCIVL